jgi:pyruvate dehydrogenase (quinone)
MASGAGLFAKRVKNPADLADAMRAILGHDGPALLDVVSARQELAIPPKIGVEQAAGFSLWLAKAVINGRGSEILDLARTNLFR